ncbi:Ger(x)C family spore germination protein [Paenibacillus sp. 481]|uniref:Ger(x)C family spore germination protein n=1 Tax=Paenibacillus sp. 481 TaxID=2835869 RepID=UPI001E55B5AB|nr:Ger(x)C family spore germination C-terminal domain-containing protein [Paenibacillus sp. 481]UHA72574.1 hypothetical protein KIK04_18215 [Paenibacillus sp. 481]
MASRHWIAIVFVLLAGLTVGCQNKTIVNEAGFIQTITIDKSDDHMFEFGISFPQTKETGKTSFAYITIKATDFPGAYRKLILKTRYKLVLGQLRNVIVGKSVAQDDVIDVLRNLIYDPELPLSANLFIYDGKASDLLRNHLDELNYTLYRLLLKLNQNKGISMSTIFNFVRDYLDDGAEPLASHLRSTKEDVYVQGIALFQGGKWTYTLPEKDVAYMLMMRNDRMNTYVYMPPKTFGAPFSLVIDNAKAKRWIKVKQVSPEIEIDIYVSLSGSVITPLNELIKAESRPAAYIEQKVEEEMNKVMQELQKQRTDAVNLGMYVRNKMGYPAYSQAKWREQFAHARIRCHVQFQMDNQL